MSSKMRVSALLMIASRITGEEITSYTSWATTIASSKNFLIVKSPHVPYIVQFEDNKRATIKLIGIHLFIQQVVIFPSTVVFTQNEKKLIGIKLNGDVRFGHFKGKFDYFSKELCRVGVTKRLLWEDYRSDYPVGYSHSQFCFHLSQQLVARKPSMVLQHSAGEKLFIDFAGKKLSYIDPDTGEVVSCQVFVACLPYSDYSFAMAVRSQSVSDFLYALGCCIQELGGVPQVLVPDNMKSAIIKASRYEPDVNRALEDFANHYHTTVIPTYL
jgi:hypothetical protein